MADGLDGLRASPVLRWMGALSIRAAMLALAAGTLLGIVITLVLSLEPGWTLGFFIIIGTLAAALGVRRGAVYLFFPLPTLAFFLSAVVTGFVKDSSLTSTSLGVSAGFLQWIADIFFPMVVATVIVLLVGGTRWLLGRPLVMGAALSSGPPGAPGARPAPVSPGPSGRRPASGGGVWDEPERTGNRGPRPEQDRTPTADRPGRPANDRRDGRDPWGDPRARDARDQHSDRPGPQPPDPRTTAQRPRPRDGWGPAEGERTQHQPRVSRDPWDER